MPDANGNLIGIGDFVNGRRIRFHSALDSARLVLALRGDLGGCVQHLPDQLRIDTIFEIFGAENGHFRLRTLKSAELIWDHTPRGTPTALNWYGPGHGTDWIDFRFTVDMVDRCWFALNRADRSVVADVDRSRTADGTRVLAWTWNGGENQKWRAQIVP